MPISRSLMKRQLRRGGGIMSVAPRQGYFLGGVGDALKGAVKGITGGIKSAAKGIVSTIKDNPALALAALNFAPMLGSGAPFIGFGNTAGRLATIPGLSALGGEKTLGKTAKVFLGGSLLGGVLGEMTPEERAEVTSGRNIGALRTKLINAYKNQKTFADAEDEDAAIAEQVESDLSEYTSGAGGYAEGGRIGFDQGTPKSLLDMIKIGASGSKSGKQQISGAPEGITIDSETYNAIVKADIPLSQKIDLLASFEYGKGRDRVEKDDQEIFLGEGNYKNRNIGFGFNKDGEGFGGTVMYNMETGEPEIRGTFKKSFAEGGRIGYAKGTDEIVDQASGIMGLPQRTNAAGVKEPDLRKSGGFIPPVGVKEKADDIPAMLSNNEFVFTADAVRGMGGGDVNRGAQRLYDQMKMLEKGGKV